MKRGEIIYNLFKDNEENKKKLSARIAESKSKEGAAGASLKNSENNAFSIGLGVQEKSDSELDFSVSDGEEYIPDDFSDSDESGGTPKQKTQNAIEQSIDESVQILNPIVTGDRKRRRSVKSPKKTKKRQRNPENWKRRVNAMMREQGKEYKTAKGVMVGQKNAALGILCGSENCRFSCTQNVSIQQRRELLKSFYMLDVNAKNVLLFKSIIRKTTSRKNVHATKERQFAYQYNVVVDGKTIRVCKAAMCSLYQIGKKKLDVIQNKMKSCEFAPSLDKRGKNLNPPNKTPSEVEAFVSQHISQFPAEESHYSRNKNPHKLYLSPLLNIAKMYKLYIEQCTQEDKTAEFLISESYYRTIFNTKFNLSFRHPRSDTCSICDAGKNSAKHRISYTSAFQNQKLDREKARSDPNVLYITFDLQQTMPLPKLTTSKAFYMRQMWFYNLGIHVITTDAEMSYMLTWTEDIADRGSTEVMSALYTFFQQCELTKKRRSLIAWTDSCPGQNKNFFLICLYQVLILLDSFDVIDHKFPEVGHTYLDSDRDFGRIEKELRKHETIYTAEQYREIIRNASKKNTVVINMENHFRSLADLQDKLYVRNVTKNISNEKINFRDSVKWIRVNKYGSYLYKECYDEDASFAEVVITKSKKVPDKNQDFFPREKKIKTLSAEKVKNLKEQMQFVPLEHHWFYEKALQESSGLAEQKSKATKGKKKNIT